VQIRESSILKKAWIARLKRRKLIVAIGTTVHYLVSLVQSLRKSNYEHDRVIVLKAVSAGSWHGSGLVALVPKHRDPRPGGESGGTTSQSAVLWRPLHFGTYHLVYEAQQLPGRIRRLNMRL
jgi:hypothetical protein